MRGSTITDIQLDDSVPYNDDVLVLTLDGGRVLEVRGEFDIFNERTTVELRWRSDDGSSAPT